MVPATAIRLGAEATLQMRAMRNEMKMEGIEMDMERRPVHDEGENLTCAGIANWRLAPPAPTLPSPDHCHVRLGHDIHLRSNSLLWWREHCSLLLKLISHLILWCVHRCSQ